MDAGAYSNGVGGPEGAVDEGLGIAFDGAGGFAGRFPAARAIMLVTSGLVNGRVVLCLVEKRERVEMTSTGSENISQVDHVDAT